VLPIRIIGGGLAGSEAALQIARAGHRALLYEMRPAKQTPAHRTGQLAELVCSNSLKTEQRGTAPWLLKEELRRLGSTLIEAAARARVPAGHALTVDRDLFSGAITQMVEQNHSIEIRREEITEIPPHGITIVASGPLTTEALASSIAGLTGSERLYFYDSISPIVEADTVDESVAFRASRYGKSLDGTDDYLNCPFTREQYHQFYEALIAAEPVAAHSFDETPFFEGCLPIEELARRGVDTLRFGPMKPVGLADPRTGRTAYAVVQLRQENLRADTYNLVGFQNHLKFGDQQRILRMIPGLERAEFTRYGQMHRNTYINAPALLAPALNLRSQPNIFFAGQISGVEGYVEAIATGLMAGINAVEASEGRAIEPLPRESALGSLANYISAASARNYQPANITFDLLPALAPEDRALPRDKAARRELQCGRALDAIENYRKRRESSRSAEVFAS